MITRLNNTLLRTVVVCCGAILLQGCHPLKSLQQPDTDMPGSYTDSMVVGLRVVPMLIGAVCLMTPLS